MAPISRDDPNLQRRISSLHLSLGRGPLSYGSRRRDLASTIEILSSKLHPLYPQPGGPPHTKFPKTIMHWLLLTEDELDSIAHYYGQSTPDAFTNTYPAPMGWDKEFLARPAQNSPQLMPWDEEWLTHFSLTRRDADSSSTFSSTETAVASSCMDSWSSSSTTLVSNSAPSSRRPSRASDHGQYHHEPTETLPPTPPPLTTAERVAIKRRKLGKFMGLRGCDTPVAETERRIGLLEARLERAVRDEIFIRDDLEGCGGSRRPPKFGKGLL